jgi:hypothetical protein
MHKIAIGLYSFLFLSVSSGPIAAQETPTAQATPEQFCDYGLVFDDRCEVRTNAPGGPDQITMSRRDSAANPDEKRVVESASYNSTPQR